MIYNTEMPLIYYGLNNKHVARNIISTFNNLEYLSGKYCKWRCTALSKILYD